MPELDGDGVDLRRELTEAHTKIANLEMALQSARTIGMAMGILIERRRITPDQAFEILRTASQHDHTKLRDVADHVVLTGSVPDYPLVPFEPPGGTAMPAPD